MDQQDETRITTMDRRVDVITLKQLAGRLRKDADEGRVLNTPTMMSIVGIIEQAIGAPLNQCSFAEGAEMADKVYPGDPSMRAAFNCGVAWAIFRMHAPPTVKFRWERP